MTKRRSCPSCKSQGRDSTDNHLFLMRDGSTWYCNRCYYMERSDNVEMNYNLEELIHSKPLDIPSLKLSKEDLEFWGCKTLLDPSSGQVEALLYPVKENGKIKGYKGRKLDVDVKEGRFFKAAGTLKGNTDLFGQDLWENGRKLLIITEGEKDAIAVRKMLQKKGKSYCVVSLPNGASIESIKHNFEFVNKFEKILLIFDNDEAGRKATDSVVSLLPPGKVSVAHIPDKDAFEMYEKGKIDEFWKSLQSAQEKRPDGIVLGKDTWDIISSRPSPICIPYPEGWDHLNRMTLGIRLGELDTWTSGSGCVDSDTEYFNGFEWKRIADYSGDNVAQITDKGYLDIVKPDKYHKISCNQMYHIKTKYGIDMVLSGEHDIVYKGSSGGYKKKSVKEVIDIHSSHKTGFRGLIPTTFKVNSKGIDISDIDLRIQVMINADAHISRKKAIIRLKNERKIKRCRELLISSTKNWRIRECPSGYTVFIIDHPSEEKGFDEKYYMCSESQLRVIVEECQFWNGSKSKFYSTVKSDSDFIQYAASATGFRSRLISKDRPDRGHVEHNVYFTKSNLISFRKTLSSSPEFKPFITKDGFKYCFTVPSGMLLLRRNGNIFVTGNSGKTQIFRQLRYHIWRATGPDYDKYFGPEAEHLKNSSIGVISLEESLDEAVDGTLSIHLKERLSVKRAVTNTPWWCKFLGIESSPQDESAKRYQAWKEVMGSNRFHFFDHFGSLDEEGLLPKIQYMARALNVKFIFLDHLSIVISEFADEGGERGKIDALMTKLKRLTQELNIWIGLVVHLRKAQGKPFEEGAVPSLDDLRGSAGIKQLSNGVFTIARNQQDPDEYRRNTSSLHVLKCFDPETRVLTPDYSSVPIKSIREGDYLVRPDGTKAKVLRTRFGYDEMFRVKQSRGMDYVVSSKHDIVLTDKVVQAREFTGGKGYVDRRGHNPESPLVFPDHPWLYGLWIGDGDTRDPIISVSESQPEVLESIKQVWNRLKVKSTERGCYRVSLLGEKSLLPRFGRGEKKVVDKDIFKYSLKDRLLVLSGWIDSDGTSHNDGSGFSITIKDRELAESCIKLARSCGLRAYLRGNYSWCQGMDKKRWYHRVYITGDVLRLSMVCKNKVPREEALNGKGGRDRYISKLTVSEEGYGPYYAVQLEGNPLFLLEDFTVVSNCRFTGTTGSAGYLHFDPDTGLMLPVDSLDKMEVQF